MVKLLVAALTITSAAVGWGGGADPTEAHVANPERALASDRELAERIIQSFLERCPATHAVADLDGSIKIWARCGDLDGETMLLVKAGRITTSPSGK